MHFKRTGLFCLLTILFLGLAMGCSKKKKKPTLTSGDSNGWTRPVKEVKVADKIDMEMAKKGKDLFYTHKGKSSNLCVTCHKYEKKLIGPALKDVTKRRKPEWIMNMILAPEEMIKHDKTAKELKKEGFALEMVDMKLKRDQARALLEFLRALDGGKIKFEKE